MKTFVIAKEQVYNYYFLKHILKKYGVEVVEDMSEADVIFISICDITEISLLMRMFKKYGQSKIIIAGGFLSPLPIMKLYSHFVCVGEVFDFMKEYAKIKSVKEIEKLALLPYVATQGKDFTEINRRVDLNDVCVVKRKNGSLYVYTGKHCKARCKFCLYGNLYGENEEPEGKYKFLEKVYKENKKYMIYPMLADFDPDASLLINNRGVIDVRIKDFLNKKLYLRGIRRVRTGIEFCRDKIRKWMGKWISRDEIKEYLLITKKYNIETVLYFIAGLDREEDVLEFWDDILCYDTSLYPPIKVVHTYIDYNPYTPISDGDITKRYELDYYYKIYSYMIYKNKRVRMTPVSGISLSTWRTMMMRCKTIEEAEVVYKAKGKGIDYVYSILEKYQGLRGEVDYRKIS